jgi:hypothetical protein
MPTDSGSLKRSPAVSKMLAGMPSKQLRDRQRGKQPNPRASADQDDGLP